MNAPPDRCPECGAPRVAGLGCWEQLGMLLALEQEDPALQREHFLTVASYNLQHPARFTDDAIAGLREWSTTIADVYLPDTPAGAADRVRAWARAISREL